MRPAASAAASPRRWTCRDPRLAARSAALMRAAFCRAPGTLAVEDVPRPTPAAGEVVVRVSHCGICGSDLHWYHGQMVLPVGCPGHEISGEVADAGAGVTSLKAGDAVALEGIASCGSCRYCLAGDYQRCPAVGVVGMTIPSGFADYIKMPARHCFRVPAGVDFATPAVAAARPGGTICLLGAFTRSPAFPALFVLAKELRVIGSFVYGRAGARADFDVVLDLLRRQGAELARRLVTHRFPLESIAEAFRTASDKTTGSIKVTIAA